MCCAPIRLVHSFVIASLFSVKGGIVFSPEWPEIALRVEISDNVTCVRNRTFQLYLLPIAGSV